MSEQSEREAYNESAREYHEGKEREEMDRPMFTQRDLYAAVQGEREAIRQWCLKQESRLEGGNDCDAGSQWALADVRKWIDARPSIAVDVMGVVREYVKSMTDLDPVRGPQRYREALAALEALVTPTTTGEAKDGDKWDRTNEEEYRAHVEEAQDGGA